MMTDCEILAVTGHRPPKLGGYDLLLFDCLVRFAVTELKQIQPEYVLTGMALGWDQAIAEACDRIGIPFIACLPHDNPGSNWPDHSREYLDQLLNKAHDIWWCPGGPYEPQKMQIRNETMVDECDTLLALYDGEPQGGTHNCVNYAQMESNCLIINCWERWEPFI